MRAYGLLNQKWPPWRKYSKWTRRWKPRNSSCAPPCSEIEPPTYCSIKQTIRVVRNHNLVNNNAPAAQFKLFDDVGDLFETVRVPVRTPFCVRNDQERGPFKQQDLVGIDNFRKVLQTALELFHVGYEHVNYRGPGLKSLRDYHIRQAIIGNLWFCYFVESFVPNGCPEARTVQRLRQTLKILFSLPENLIKFIGIKNHLICNGVKVTKASPCLVDLPGPGPSCESNRISLLRANSEGWPPNSSDSSACLSRVHGTRRRKRKWGPRRFGKCYPAGWQSSSPWTLPGLRNPRDWGQDYPGNVRESAPRQLE